MNLHRLACFLEDLAAEFVEIDGRVVIGREGKGAAVIREKIGSHASLHQAPSVKLQ
jgi:hypothetical protein